MKKLHNGSVCLVIVILVLVGIILAGLGIYYLYSSGKIKISRQGGDLNKSDLFKKPEEAREIMATIVPEEKPDFTKNGVLKLRDEGEEMESWIFLYEEPGAPVLLLTLDFNNRSKCDFGQGEAICNTKKFEIGERVYVEGIKNGDLLRVINLKVVDNE